MFDAKIQQFINPALNTGAKILANAGFTANFVTIFGAMLALGCGAAIASQQYALSLCLIAANRLMDGLDGPMARLNHPSEFGGYLDSLADYIFYLAIPIGFALATPANMLPALLLVASFTLTAVSFLAFAAIAARTGQDEGTHGQKAFIYSTGLMEGAETIGFFVAMCLFPQQFALLAYIFSGLCLLTVLQRLVMAWRQFN